MVKKASRSDWGKGKAFGAAAHTPKAHKGNRASRKTNAGRNEAETAQKSAGSVCDVSQMCGGCSSIDIEYADQLAAKNREVIELFSHPRFGGADIRPILGMAEPYHYRNKVTSPFAPGKRGPNGGRAILTGMYAAGTHRIVATEACLLENEQAQQVIRCIKKLMLKMGISAYDERKGTGFMRHAVVRVGHESGEVLVTLVTNGERFDGSKAFCRELVKRCPFITTIVQNVNKRQTNVILGEKEQRLYGPGFILDTLCGLSFRISSQSFYQVNSQQTSVLYEQAIKLASLDGSQQVIDAYCGTGTIGLVAAKRGARSVIGVDSVASAIRDARENARHNGIENARFATADAGEFMMECARDAMKVDVVMMDPPRAGSTEEFLNALNALAPKRVVYISCNPKTQERDLRLMAQHGYSIDVVQPVDMFPHTKHVETIALAARALHGDAWGD